MKNGLINRHILMEQLQKKCIDSDTVDFHRGLLEAQAIVMKLPEENDRPRGKWIFDGFCFSTTKYRCSICHLPQLEKTNYCPNCGAKMQEAEND